MYLFRKTKQKKYKKFRKSRLKNLEFKATNLTFGEFGLKALESGIITSAQLLSAKQTILKKTRKKSKI
jgi:large subunit ribosomal protein L16